MSPRRLLAAINGSRPVCGLTSGKRAENANKEAYPFARVSLCALSINCAPSVSPSSRDRYSHGRLIVWMLATFPIGHLICTTFFAVLDHAILKIQSFGSAVLRGEGNGEKMR